MAAPDATEAATSSRSILTCCTGGATGLANLFSLPTGGEQQHGSHKASDEIENDQLSTQATGGKQSERSCVSEPTEGNDTPGLHRTSSTLGLSEADLEKFLRMADEQSAAEKEFDEQAQFVQLVWAAGVCCSYLLGGILFYHFQEEMDYVDSFYFVVVTVTTVGYGDLYPTTTAGKWFTCFYVFFGISLLGIALGLKGAAVMEEAQTDALFANVVHATERTDEQLDKRRRQPRSSLARFVRRAKKFAIAFLPSMVFVVIGVPFFTDVFDEDFTITDAVYYACITGTTVGYGDLSPKSDGGKIFAMFWIFLGVLVVGWSIQSIGDIYLRQQLKRAQKRKLARNLTVRDLMLHGGDDGKLDISEFALAKLMAQGKITNGDVQECHRQFHGMDTDKSGYIDVQDLLGNPDAEQASLAENVSDSDSDRETQMMESCRAQCGGGNEGGNEAVRG